MKLTTLKFLYPVPFQPAFLVKHSVGPVVFQWHQSPPTDNTLLQVETDKLLPLETFLTIATLALGRDLSVAVFVLAFSQHH